jgi:hypothetical protein
MEKYLKDFNKKISLLNRSLRKAYMDVNLDAQPGRQPSLTISRKD